MLLLPLNRPDITFVSASLRALFWKDKCYYVAIDLNTSSHINTITLDGELLSYEDCSSGLLLLLSKGCTSSLVSLDYCCPLFKMHHHVALIHEARLYLQ